MTSEVSVQEKAVAYGWFFYDIMVNTVYVTRNCEAASNSDNKSLIAKLAVLPAITATAHEYYIEGKSEFVQFPSY